MSRSAARFKQSSDRPRRRWPKQSIQLFRENSINYYSAYMSGAWRAGRRSWAPTPGDWRPANCASQWPARPWRGAPDASQLFQLIRDVRRNKRSAFAPSRAKGGATCRHGHLGGCACDEAAQYAALTACKWLRLGAMRLLRLTLTVWRIAHALAVKVHKTAVRAPPFGRPRSATTFFWPYRPRPRPSVLATRG